MLANITTDIATESEQGMKQGESIIKKGSQLRCDPLCADSIVIIFGFLVLP